MGDVMFRSKLIILLAVLASSWSIYSFSADPLDSNRKPETDPPQSPAEEGAKWMQQKLHGTHQIFDGLMQGDFEKMENQARRMVVLQFLENWVVENKFTRKSAYQGQLNSYEFALKELRRSAEAKDIDGSFDAYTRLTRSCVECHKLLRDVPSLGPISGSSK
jgi:hypothetical protein